jgi:transcription antitermination factor NusG
MSRPQFWCAVQVVPRHELRVAGLLSNAGYEQFIPMYISRRKWSDRYKSLELPLFPGYVFCRIQKETACGVFKTPGVNRIISFGGKICPIDDCEIATLRQVVNSGREVSPGGHCKIGDRVQIQKGPLTGVVGRLLFVKNRWQLAISVDMLMKSATVIVDASEVNSVLAKAA